MSTITVDGLNEETFRRVIEGRLRLGKPDEAIDKLRLLLVPYAGPGRILPERFLTVQSGDLHISGWDALGDAIARLDQPGWPITAVSVAFGWPGEDLPRPDPEGRLKPLIDTGFFTDRAYPFSHSSREDLLDGYSYHGCTWADETEAVEQVLSLEGIDDLHGALAGLEARLLDSEEPDDEEIRAGSLGACLLSALLVKAVGERIERDGLPRPLCVMAGSNGVYPYFDAPVAGMPEHAIKAAEEEEIPAGQGVPGPRYSSLLVTGIPRARKRAVLVLDETAEETALRNANLRGLIHGDQTPAQEPERAAAAAPPELADSGIIPMPGGPLMTKKPPKQSWDFRDMLGPRDPEPPQQFGPSPDWDEWDEWGEEAGSDRDEPASREREPTPPEPPRPEPVSSEPEPVVPTIEPDAPEAPRAEPPRSEPPKPFGERLPRAPEYEAPAAPRVPVLSVVPAPEPGFALLETSVQERLQALVAAPAPAIDEPGPEPEPAPAVRREATPAPEGPVWPLGIGWLEDAASEAADNAALPPEDPAPQRGLFARLRLWLARL